MDPQESSTTPKSVSLEAPKNPGSLSISHLPPDVQARILARAAVARKAKAEYWAYVEEQDAKETP
jgi:hypothetical protein